MRERLDVGAETFEPRRDGTRHQRGGQLAGARQQRHGVFIHLAGHARTAGGVGVEQKPHQLVLDEAALFLDDENFLKPLRKSARFRWLDRPREPHLVESNAKRGGVTIIQPELHQRLADIEIGFSSRDDPQSRVRRIDDGPIDVVDPRERMHGSHFGAVHSLLLIERPVHGAGGPADV